MTKRVVCTTYPNLILMSPVYGLNERIGVEGLELIGEQQMYTSTSATELLVDLDVLVEVHVECSIKRSADRGDMSIIPGWNLRGGARTADEDHP